MKIKFKGQKLLILYLFLFILILTSPFWLWTFKDSKLLNVLIIDKTVPSTDFREHEGFVWLLNNEKYVKKNKQAYSVQQDYVGFKPERNKTFKIENLPENMNQYDLIYLTDLYGVYKEEFENSNQSGERSEQVYGGLTNDEVEKLDKTLLTWGRR
ncbi:hypothetical protein [Bacillus sp. T3]|uniref:hypothetical protein n=1 Tax=Bacillus sp. T3 TaxID=467262 RepID=UPI002981E9EE|nr:hypothetical protein [Bacillus sp. T3]